MYLLPCLGRNSCLISCIFKNTKWILCTIKNIFSLAPALWTLECVTKYGNFLFTSIRGWGLHTATKVFRQEKAKKKMGNNNPWILPGKTRSKSSSQRGPCCRHLLEQQFWNFIYTGLLRAEGNCLSSQNIIKLQRALVSVCFHFYIQKRSKINLQADLLW